MKNSKELQGVLYGLYTESRSFREGHSKSINWIAGMSDLSVELFKEGVLTEKQLENIQEALLGLNGDIAGFENKMQAALNG